MKISFILPGVGISGGVKAVFEFANQLLLKGHEVVVYYPLVPLLDDSKWYNFKSSFRKAKGLIKELLKIEKIDWFDLKARVARVPSLDEGYIENADIIVATWWVTAYWVKKYSAAKGEKFYLVQHYEIWGGPAKNVNESYRLGLHIIVNSTWLKDILMKEVNVKADSLIFHAPDYEHFYPEEKKCKNNKIRIIIPYRKASWKGTEDGIIAYRRLRKGRSDIQLVMYGPDRGSNLPEEVEFHYRPSNNKLREIYNSGDIFVFPSHSEGFGMPPMEAMACKCAVVATNVGAVPDYVIPGKTALVVHPKRPDLLTENVNKLIEDAELRGKIALAGYNYITEKFSWGKSTDMLENLFLKSLKK